MRLLRVGNPGFERPAVGRADGSVVDVSDRVEDYTPEFFAADGLARLAALADEDLPVVAPDERIGAPVARPGKIVCIGHNYAGHIAEVGAEIPTEPTLFLKATSALCGPNDDILIPPGSQRTDWEIELAIVIATTAEYLPDTDAAREAIAGFTLSNDVSEREFQIKRGGQWTKGKSFSTFNPLGPWIATADEMADPRALQLQLDVNGERMQTGDTSDMVFDVYEIVRYVSNVMRLEPGDIINTGTPSGVGMGQKPRRFLAEGDVIEMRAEGLGTQRHVCRQLSH